MATDFNALRLKYQGYSDKLEEVLQQECREKCAKKLNETLTHDDFKFPSLALAEMCTSDAVADVHAGMIPEGRTVLDMTAGLGIDDFHFARKGCRVTAIELDSKAAIVLNANIKSLGLSDLIEVINADSVEWLHTHPGHFDVIYVDPARRDATGRHFSFSQCLPDITRCMGLLQTRCDTLMIKASPMIDIASGMLQLGVTENCDITIIGTTGECKEVVFSIGKGSQNKIRCVTVGKSTYELTPGNSFTIFKLTPTPGQWLQQPYPAVMKSGGNVAGLKLHTNTHLYVSDDLDSNFPGQHYSILEVLPFNKRIIKDLAKSHPKINVATRNFPISAPELAKRLKVKDGGDKMVFGVTLWDESRWLIITSMAE